MSKITNFSPTFPMFPGDAASVTTSDSTTFNPSVVFTGSGGIIRVTTAQGTDATFTNVQPGAILPLQVIKVWATTTTATGLLRIF